MAIDFSSEMNSILEGSIPEWFYQLSVDQRNAIMKSALTQYELVTIAKNNTFLAHWAKLIEPYKK
jgi:hypothetical protein